MTNLEKSNKMDKSLYKNFNYRKFRVNFRVVRPFVFRNNPYLLIRGIFGKILYEEVCVHRELQTCELCPQNKSCPYTEIYKMRPLNPGHALYRRYTYPPVPYIIYPNLNGHTRFNYGDTFSIELTLIGKASEYDTFCLQALQQLSRGKGQLFHKLECVGAETLVGEDKKSLMRLNNESKSIAQLQLNFQSPLVMEAVSAQDSFILPFSTLVKSISERMSVLNHLYCNGSEPDLDHLPDEISEVESLNSFYAFKTKVKDGGKRNAFKGSVIYRNIPGQYWPVVEAGEVLHIGKLTNYGYGKYIIDESYSFS